MSSVDGKFGLSPGFMIGSVDGKFGLSLLYDF